MTTIALLLFCLPMQDRVILWDSAIAVTGDHLRSGRRPRGYVGTPTAGALAIDYLQCEAIANGRRTLWFTETSADYLYLKARTSFGTKYQGHGVTYEDMANACASCGRMPDSSWTYWGINHWGPWSVMNRVYRMDRLVIEAKEVFKRDECIRAMRSRNPVLLGIRHSFVGDTVKSDGKFYGKISGTNWVTMAVMVGYDANGRNGDAFCIDNHWPISYGLCPEDGAPPHSFWIDGDVLDRVLRQAPSYELVGAK